MKDKTPFHRRSIRLKGYDYSKSGAYFITICVKDRIHFFGKIENGKMILNDAGKMIDKWWQKIPLKFPDIELGDYQIMPNHFHAIVINNGIGNPQMVDSVGADSVGADPRVRPPNEPHDNAIVRADPGVRPPNEPYDNAIVRADPGVRPHNELHDNAIVRADPGVRPENDSAPLLGETMEPLLGEHMGSPLHGVVQWFKTMSTNEYIRGVKSLDWPPFNGKLWHRNYYEHIIRDEKSCTNIANYIINNPAKWNEDTFNK